MIDKEEAYTPQQMAAYESMMKDKIPMTDCLDRHLYLIEARNAQIGVYAAEKKAFILARLKFGEVYLDVEYHWDTGAPHGTAVPKRDLGPVAVENLPREKLLPYLLEQEKDHLGMDKVYMGRLWKQAEQKGLT